MKTLTNFIYEKLNTDYLWNVSYYFNKACKPTKNRNSVKDGDTIYLLRFDVDTQKLIKEYEAKAKVEHKSNPPYWEYTNYFVDYNHVNGLPEYLEKEKFRTHLSSDVDGIPTVEALEFDDDDKELAFIVWNKENKDTFIKWIEELPNDYWDKIQAEAEKKQKKADQRRQQYLANKVKNFVPKIPKKLYSDEVAIGSELITKISNNLHISKGMLKTLFTGLESSTFDVIYWNGNGGGYDDADNAINKLFPGDESYYLYSEKADLWKNIKDNGCIAKFTANNNKAICIADNGDYGEVYVCVEQ